MAGLHIDVMTHLRGLAPFAELWARRTTFSFEDETLEVLADRRTAEKRAHHIRTELCVTAVVRPAEWCRPLPNDSGTTAEPLPAGEIPRHVATTAIRLRTQLLAYVAIAEKLTELGQPAGHRWTAGEVKTLITQSFLA